MNGLKMKIAFFMTNTHFRGGVISLYYILKHLDRAAYDPIFITCCDGEHVSRIRELGVEVFIFPVPYGALSIGRNRFIRDILRNLFGLFQMLIAVVRIARFLRRSGIDLVHTQDQKSSVLGSIAGVLGRVPVVWHVRDVPFGAANAVDQVFGIFTKKIIAISGVVAAPFRKNPFLKGKVSVVYNGFDPSIFNQSVDGSGFRASTGTEGRFLIGQAASLIPIKGIEYFIEAARTLVQAGFPGVFVVIGDNKVAQYRGYENKLKRMVGEYGLEEQFRFLEFSNRVEEVMAGFNLFVFTSLGDGFGKVVIEAMGMGIPVVAFDAGANREIIEDGVSGVMVPARDSVALAESIRRLAADDELRTRIAEGGRRRAFQLFNIRDTVKGIEEVYSLLKDERIKGAKCAGSAG